MTRKLDGLSDEELMTLYKGGDELAFDTLYERYASRIYGYLRKRLRNPQAVNDVFQATFLKLHRSRDQFNSSFLFAPWLFAVLRTVFLDWQKSSQNKQTSLELNENCTPRFFVNEPAISRADISVLAEPQRAAVEMRYFDELSFEEIAARLSTSSDNVRQLISRGIKKLRFLLTKGGSL